MPQSRPIGHLKTALRSLRHRNYRLFWTGEAVSLIGTWMQSIGQAWLVVELTGSALKLGLLSTVQFLPMMLLSLYAGTLADRFSKRTLLLITQSALAILSALLAVLTATGVVQFWMLLVLGLFLGLVNTLDIPARQSFFVELVGREDLLNAIALNSGIFNLARILGPAVGGLLIGTVGMTACFGLNAISYLAVIASLLRIRLPKKPAPPRAKHTFKKATLGVIQGLRYIKRREGIKQPLVLLALLSIFVMNFNVMFPIFASQDLGRDAAGLGLMMASMAAGSLAGSLTLAVFSRKGPRVKPLLAGSLGMSVFLALLGVESGFLLVSGTLFLLGFSTMMMAALINSTIQLRSGDNMRGRVMSVYSLVLGGVTPIGALFAGNIMEFTGGARVCLLVSGGIGVAATLYSAFRMRGQLAAEGEADSF